MTFALLTISPSFVYRHVPRIFANSGCELEPAYSVRRRYDSAIVVEPQVVRE